MPISCGLKAVDHAFWLDLLAFAFATRLAADGAPAALAEPSMEA